MGLKTIPLWVPLQPDGTTQVQHPAELLRALTKTMSTRSGVTRPPSAVSATNTGGFAATVVPGAMQLTVAAGAAFAVGRETTLQATGSYFAYSDASEVVAWPAAGGSNRMDSLILRFPDPQYGAAAYQCYWDPVAGSSASARPDSDFTSGGTQYIAGGWLRMYDILVPASATQLTQGNVAFKAGYANTMGYTPFFSTARPAGLYIGERGAEVDTGFPYVWNGTKWIRDRVDITLAAQQSYTNTTLTDIPGFTFPGEANCTYQFDAWFSTVGPTAADFNITWVLPASATIEWGMLTPSLTDAGTYPTTIDLASTTGTFRGVSGMASSGAAARATGLITLAGTAGTCKLQASQWVASGTGFIRLGSWMSYRQVT